MTQLGPFVTYQGGLAGPGVSSDSAVGNRSAMLYVLTSVL